MYLILDDFYLDLPVSTLVLSSIASNVLFNYMYFTFQIL